MSKKVININPKEKYVKEIITDYDKLSERCYEFDLTKNNKDVQKIVLELKNTIRANENMLGLSANQIGYEERILCLNFNGDIRTFINPIITSADGFELSRETCHSIPGKTYIRTRNNKVSITYQTPLSKIESIDLVGFAATVFQHHLDHLDGLLLSDVGLEIDEEFDNASIEEREAVIDMYLDSLDLTRKQLEEEVENDEEGKQLKDAVRFINSVKSGETVVESFPLTEEEIEELKKKEKELEEKQEKEETSQDENK